MFIFYVQLDLNGKFIQLKALHAHKTYRLKKFNTVNTAWRKFHE